MKIHVLNNARSFLVMYWNDNGSEWEDAFPYSTIDEALAAAENEIDNRCQANGAHIIDADTGEIYITCYYDENEDYPDYNDDVDESNYDPYAGCDMYDFEPFDGSW